VAVVGGGAGVRVRRPGNRVSGLRGAWLVGGTVHPGGGLPLVMLGGATVARAIGPAR
jgi:phytoene dehydrogenase-like protein